MGPDWQKVWQLNEEEYDGLSEAIERFASAMDPDLEIEFRYVAREDGGGAIYFFIEPEEIPMWVGILRAFEHGFAAGRARAVAGEYNGDPYVEYPEDGGLHLFAPVALPGSR